MWEIYLRIQKNAFTKYVLGEKYVILYYEFKTLYSLYEEDIHFNVCMYGYVCM